MTVNAAAEKSEKKKHLLIDAGITLAIYIVSAFFFSAEKSLLITMSLSTLLLIVEINRDIMFRGWFVALVSAVAVANLCTIFLTKHPDEFKGALFLAPIFVLQFVILYGVVAALKRRVTL